MPADLRQHLRYPAALLRTQADVLEEYHVEDPAVFFAGQNQWQVPSEGGPAGTAGTATPPIHTMIPGPDGDVAFRVVTSFIARERPNMTAILLVDNEPDTYGRITLMRLPRDQQVAGPRQVRVIVEQDPAISTQFSLWRQGGSDVEIGQIRMVPLDSAILYVMPVFLKGSESALPQLRLVLVSDGIQVRMATTMRAAVEALAAAEPGTVATNIRPGETQDAPSVSTEDWASRALDVANAAEQALRNGDLAEFGRRWSELQGLIRRAAAQPPR
jgi:uncharacterized membrane protein (UPF0182 family)